MAQQSMGAALENIMVAAHALGLASYWISAPLFAPEAVHEALGLAAGYEAQALVAIGYPASEPRPRPEPDISALIERR
jgi:nitroreductase